MELPTNLSTKNIKDFKPKDIIYIRITENPQYPKVALCEFIKLEKNRVHGKVLRTDMSKETESYRINRGWEISATIENCALYGQDEEMQHNRFYWFSPTGVAFTESPEDVAPKMPEEHPSYGTLSISKVTKSHAAPCFGSPILVNSVIHLSLCTAKISRSLHNDNIYANEEIVRVEMTPQQFSDMLTSPNSGSGTPVTITRLLGKGVEDTPFVSKLEQFQGELKEKIKGINHKTKTLTEEFTELIERSKLAKKEKEYMLKLLDSLNMEVESNLPFLTSQLGEEMDKVVGEAKSAINSYLETQARIRNIPLTDATPILQLEECNEVDIENSEINNE